MYKKYCNRLRPDEFRNGLVSENIFKTPEAAVRAWAHLVNRGDIDVLEQLYAGVNHFKPTLKDGPVDPYTESRSYFEALNAKKVILCEDGMEICVGRGHATIKGPYRFLIKKADGKIQETHAEYRFDLVWAESGWRITQHRSNRVANICSMGRQPA